MALLKLLNLQGLAGLVVASCLAILLVLQKGETRHWKKQAGQFEQLYRGEQSAFAGTVANYRAAAEAARAADQANIQRVAAAAANINERTVHDYEDRIAAARALAARLQRNTEAAAHPGVGGTASVPGAGADRPEAAQASGQDRLPKSDRLIATEQAIQLDELIKAVKALQGIDPNDAKQAH